MRILLIEDEQRLAHIIKKGLSEEGFAVDQAFDGTEGQYLAETEPYDLIILDLKLPKKDGLSICRELREKKIKIPILMLTAKSMTEDKVSGLDSGADDYITKPFAFIELLSRIRALIRRSKGDSSPILKIADLKLDPLKHQVTRLDKKISLTPKEFAILEFLLHHKATVVSRTIITEHIWDYNFDSLTNIVDVFIASLRKKIDREAKVKLIHTIHGVGYKISETP